MEPFTKLTGIVAPLDRVNVDTDQIIPKQFLKRIERTGFGQFLFFDWRYLEDGKTPDPAFELNQPEYQGATILVTGRNFGCGSSREHAPWALAGYGFRAIISTSFADIFRNNALKNGLLPIVVDKDTHQQLFSLVEEDPATTLAVDLATQTVTLPDGRRVSFPIDRFSKTCLLNGVDEIGYVLNMREQIEAFERARAQ